MPPSPDAEGFRSQIQQLRAEVRLTFGHPTSTSADSFTYLQQCELCL